MNLSPELPTGTTWPQMHPSFGCEETRRSHDCVPEMDALRTTRGMMTLLYPRADQSRWAAPAFFTAPQPLGQPKNDHTCQRYDSY